jgi:hypothetical protein
LLSRRTLPGLRFAPQCPALGRQFQAAAVSTAAYRRIFYYLTADERTGDLMREPLDSDERLRFVDIGRKLRPEGAPPLQQTYVGFGTDWCSLAAAWLTEWERTGATKWRDKILNGMRTIGALPRGWFAGGSAYDTATGRFLGPGDTVSISHLNAVFGAVEINAELLSPLDAPEYKKTWLQYCRAYNAPPDEQENRWEPCQKAESGGSALAADRLRRRRHG